LETSFGLHRSDWREVTNGILSNKSGELEVLLAIVPATTSGRRATTEEGIRWITNATGLEERSRILLVTLSLYWIANQISVRIALPDATEVASVGYDQSLAPGVAPILSAQHYLQEIKSAIDALPKLQNWISQPKGF
jgi:hypothetical protein